MSDDFSGIDDPFWTPKQIKIVELVAKGMTNWQISDVIGLRPATIKHYIHDMCKDVGVDGRMNLVNAARYFQYLGTNVYVADEDGAMVTARRQGAAIREAQEALTQATRRVNGLKDRLTWYVARHNVHPGVIENTTEIIIELERATRALELKEGNDEHGD